MCIRDSADTTSEEETETEKATQCHDADTTELEEVNTQNQCMTNWITLEKATETVCDDADTTDEEALTLEEKECLIIWVEKAMVCDTADEEQVLMEMPSTSVSHLLVI